MEKKPFYWLTMSYAGTFGNIKVKNDQAEEKNLSDGLYFTKEEEKDAKHLMWLIQAVIKANYSRAKDWYQDLPQEYIDLLDKLKIERLKD